MRAMLPVVAQLARASRCFALVADLTVALLGGGLKVKQKITGRMADALAELYLLSSVLKRFDDDGRPPEDLKLVDYCAQNCLYRFDQALLGVLEISRFAAPRGRCGRWCFPSAHGGARRATKRGKEIVRAALEPGAYPRPAHARDLHANDPADRGRHSRTTRCAKVVANEEADKKLERAIRKGEVKRFHDHDWIAEAEAKGVLTSEEARALAELRDLVARVIAVDDFDRRGIAAGPGAVAQKPQEHPSPKPEHIAAE